MQPKIESLGEKKLIGLHLSMTFENNQTAKLWQSFMPRRKEIKNNLTSELFSMQVYPQSFNFDEFDVSATFQKFAAIEVAGFDMIPFGMETFILPGGLYAVFYYKGLSTDTRIFKYIFKTWLPSSNYTLDNRPHFEILREKFKNNDPNSEEEIWVPIKLKT